jgi:hypothetical protein
MNVCTCCVALPKQEPIPVRYNGTQYFRNLRLAKLNMMRAFKIHLAANLKEPVVNRTIHYVLLFMYAYTYIYLYRTKLIKRIYYVRVKLYIFVKLPLGGGIFLSILFREKNEKGKDQKEEI